MNIESPGVAVGWLLYLLILAGCVSLYVYSLVWVYRDAEKHGKPGFVVALLVGLLCWPAGLLVWLLIRDNLKGANTPPIPGAPPRNCPQCGTALATDAPQGLCPACLLKRGMATDSQPSEGERAAFVPPSTADLAGHFPELEILELVGRGGMGAVYKARQKRLDRFIALKILPSNVSRDPAFAERFAREARALARLAHPNIVAVHDFGQTDGQFFFLMEFVDGMNLRQLLNTGRMAPKEALAIVPQICDALQYAHDNGIVHRDIKPENILLAKDGTVKIADFGLAKLVGLEAKDLRITGSGEVMGTPHYMAPEQVEHPRDVDHRADIYSLGVVFYQMLTGELPIGRFAPPSRKVQIDVRLDEVILRALEKEPALRYQQASEVKTQVETIVTTPAASLGAHRAPLQPETPRLSRLAVGGAVFALLFPVTFTLLRIVDHTIINFSPTWRQGITWVTFSALSVGEPIGATILGCLALTQIRRSAGKLYGLGLALFDTLLFPLLALDGLLWALWRQAYAVFGSWHNLGVEAFSHPSYSLADQNWVLVLTVTAASAVLVDFLIVRWAWRAVK